MNAPIQLYNTITREKSPLRTPVPGRVTLYVGGPTLHDHAHLGNVRPAVVFDVLARLLRLHYPDVLHVGRLADVDDRIHAAALAAGESVEAFTARYRDAWREDLDALGVLAPDVEPRASEQVAGVVEQAARLLERGHAYIEAGHVLFHVPSYPGHGRLCGRPVEDMIALARGEPAPRRRHPLDFVLWKPAEHGFPAWPSPWGAGRPGWHAQSTAVLERELGREIDIHGGGQDLIHPHHENEIAQLACANGMPPSRTWLHNAFLTVNWQKMSKPLRNVVTLRALRERASGEAIRLALLSVHYRQPLNWNLQRLSSARRTLTRGYHVLAAARDTPRRHRGGTRRGGAGRAAQRPQRAGRAGAAQRPAGRCRRRGDRIRPDPREVAPAGFRAAARPAAALARIGPARTRRRGRAARTRAARAGR